jgi:hypothetical protein
MTASTDSSTRYVLGAGHPYVENLGAIWGVDAGLAQRLEAEDEQAGRVIVEASRTGPPTLSVRGADGRVVSLHSRYDPVAEARKLVGSVRVDGPVAFYLLGMGLGYHLEEVFERASSEALFFVFEADLGVMRAAMEKRDLTPLIRSGRVMFFTSADKADLFLKLTPHAAMCSMGLEGVTHSPSLGLHPAFYRQVHEWLTEFAAFGRTSLNTLVLNGRRTAQNVTRNIATYATTPSVSQLKDAYKGKPAIIVSAGPSLRKNEHLLKDADGRAVIIAVQTILQPLLDMGIEPQFVTSLDYHDISTRYYEKLPRDLKTQLVAEAKASPRIFDAFPGPVWTLGNAYADSLLREMTGRGGLEKGRLSSGATVAHLAFYLAEHLGCDPLIFVGQDLGFSDGLAYSPGTNIDDVWRPELNRFCTVEMRQWEFIARERPILRKIPDQEGRGMYTEERLFTYLQQFERDFLRTKSRVIDATEGGARKRGATVMTLRDALDQFCRNGSIAWNAHGICSVGFGRERDVSSCLRRRGEEANQTAEIALETLPLLEEVRDNLNNQRRVNHAIARIDLLRARMDSLGATYDLVTQFTQSTELRRFQKDRRIASEGLCGVELQRRQIERDVENVRAIAEAAREFVQSVEEVIAEMRVDEVAEPLRLREVV